MKPRSQKMISRAAAIVMAAWVICLNSDGPALAEQVTGGCLQVVDKDMHPIGMCPLKHTDVRADISGFIARVTVTQQFENPFETPIEAIYTFPLSDRAAVDSMTMRIGDRVIKGIIKERDEARRIYQAARDAGKAAALLDQERPNIFTQSVANILPGDRIEIMISYVEYLKYEEGEYEFSFPMVVGPRYIPGVPTTPPMDAIQADVVPGPRPGPESTDQVPDADRITPPITPEGTRAGHDIALEVAVDAGVPIRDVKSELHEAEVERPAETQAVVRLKSRQEIPNRDFVLKYAVAGKAIGDAVLTHAGTKGSFFTLILQPPDRVSPEQVTPKELIFVIDRSGSMSGFPIEKAKKTMRMCIEGMHPNDTFNLFSFSGGLGACFEKPIPNTPENRKKALDYLDGLHGSGGTEMMQAIRAALEHQDDPERLRVVCFMTDAFIGNDMAVLDAIRRNAGTARVFAFGIGNSVNRFLIEGMALEGRGAAEIVTLESDADNAAKRFHERVRTPVLTDITVDFGSLAVQDVYPDPGTVPDLFSAQPLILKGKYSAPGEGVITVRGNTAAGPFERQIRVSLPQDEPGHNVLAPLWARSRVEWLMRQDWLGLQQGKPDSNMKDEVTRLGLEFNLVTQFTSFVAVEEKQITEGGKPKTVQVPVEMPDGVSYEGVFGERIPRGVVCTKSVPILGGVASGLYVGKDESKLMVQAVPEGRERTQPPVPQHIRRDEKGHPKLDRALWNLEAKLVDGNYTEGPVKVRDGVVEVFIRLSDDSPEQLKELGKLVVSIVSHASSSKTVLTRVKVTDLKKIADLPFVKLVEPPKF